MFKPTSFPCTAWHVTNALNVRQVTITGKHHYGGFLTNGPYCSYSSDLYETRENAVAGAAEKLALSERRMAKAQENLARKRRRVEALKLEMGGQAV